jgi:biotin carboxylase
MGKLYILHEALNSDIADRINMLVSSAKGSGLTCEVMDSTQTSHFKLPSLGKDDFLYNIARGSKHLELLMLNDQVVTFYRKRPEFVRLNTIEQAIAFRKAGLASPPAIFHSTSNKKLLSSYVDLLGGYPVIVKVSGGTKGVGTILAPDSASLQSITDYLASVSARFMLMKYIEPKEVARLIVIGNHVVASNRKPIPEGDFRTSVKDKLPEAKTYPPDIQQLAVRTAEVANSENCGVDILIDINNIAYVLEGNMPHDFVTTVKATGIDVTGAMVNFLIEKASKCILG